MTMEENKNISETTEQTTNEDESLKEFNLLNIDNVISTVFKGYHKAEVKKYIASLLHTHAEETKNLTSLVETLKAQNVSLKSDLTTAIDKYNEIVQKMEDPEEKFREERKELKDKIAELESTIHKNEAAFREADVLQDSNKRLASSLKDKEELINTQNGKIDELNDRIHTLTLAISEKDAGYEKEMREKDAEIKTKAAENAALTEKNAALLKIVNDGEIAELRVSNKKANIEIERLSSIRVSEEAELKRLGETNKDLSDRNERLTKDLQNTTKEKERLQEDVTKLMGHKTLLEKELKDKYSENISLMEALYDAKALAK